VSDARIIDRGYRPYDGPRLGPRGAVRSLMRHTAQRVMGLKRPGRAKILPFLAVMIAYVPAIVFVGVAALIPDNRVRTNFLPTYGQYYGFIASALIVFVCFVAPEALCPDRRTGLLGLYLASPLSRATYLGAKVMTILGLLLVATVGPPLLMLVAFVLQGIGPDGPGDVVLVFVRVVVSGVVLGAMFTAVSMGVASLTDRKSLASACTLLLFVLSGAVTGILVGGIGAPEWVIALNLTAAPLHLVQRIYGEAGDPEVAGVATWVFALSCFVWTVLGAGVTAWRYRSLKLVR
jgi:ABC-2 type transport system permease protein